MIQVKTITRKLNPWPKQFWQTFENLVEYEKRVNAFCETVNVISINTIKLNSGRLEHTIVYDDGRVKQ